MSKRRLLTADEVINQVAEVLPENDGDFIEHRKNKEPRRKEIPMSEVKKVIMVCARCGSTDVRRDAESAWNVEKQEWELVVAYDNATCEACKRECDLEEVEIDNDGNCIYCGLKCYEGQLCDEQQAGGFNKDDDDEGE